MVNFAIAQRERSYVNAGDRFEPHGLPVEEEAQLRQQLVCYPQIKEAYLVRKVVQYFLEKHFYVLGVIRRRSLIESKGEDHKLYQRLATDLKFPGYSWIAVFNSANNPLAKALRQTATVPIYRR